MKTLVIHTQDKSTDFLKPIYESITDKTVITGGMHINEVNELIKTHDRVIMLGHGCPDGLFSMGKFTDSYGLVISDDTVELLKEKTDNIYVWCNADQFVRRHELKGFFSGMFISEVGEAWACGIKFTHTTDGRNEMQDEVTLSNNMFSFILGKFVNEPIMIIHENVTKEYGVLAETSKVAEYNNERLYCVVPLEEPKEVSEWMKNEVLKRDPGATFTGTIINTKLDYDELNDLANLEPIEK